VTITRFSNNYYEGLTADTKPTNVPAGATFRDTQLDIIYEFNGTTWDIIIGNTKTETLSNKTIAAGSNTITGIADANIDNAAAIATSKLADSANFLLTTNTKTVTNKLYDLKNNTWLRFARAGTYSPASVLGITDDTWGMLVGLTGVGTQSVNANTGGKYHRWETAGTVADDVAGVLKLDTYTAFRNMNPLIRFAFLFNVNTSNNRRMFKGWGPQRMLTLTSDTAPLDSGEAGFLFGHGAADTEFQIFHNDTTGACVKESTGFTMPVINTNYILDISASDSGASFTWTLYGVSAVGNRGSSSLATGTITTDIPAATTGLYCQDLIVGSTTAVQQNNIHYIEVFTS
jgi:hypothetical protein